MVYSGTKLPSKISSFEYVPWLLIFWIQGIFSSFHCSYYCNESRSDQWRKNNNDIKYLTQDVIYWNHHVNKHYPILSFE